LTPALFSGTGLACLRGERIVFAGLEFRLEPGGLLLLRGRNGTGKSSLLRLMAGLLRPFAGSLEWEGRPMDPGEHGTRIHYVGHLDGAKGVLTARETLGFWAGLHRADGSAGRVHQAIGAFGLEAVADLPARFLSAGQRRRLALARGIAAPVPLWLLDEPTVGLDHDSIAALESAVAQHRAAGGAAVLSTHGEITARDAQALDVERFADEASA
jgi:heme exporter protein A